MPSLDGILDYVKKEGANIVWIVLIFFAVKFLLKQEWAKMMTFFIAAGVSYYVIQNPNVVSDALAKIAEVLF